MQSKIQSLAGQHSDVLETLSPNVRKRVESLREIQVYPLIDSSVSMLLFVDSLYFLSSNFNWED